MSDKETKYGLWLEVGRAVVAGIVALVGAALMVRGMFAEIDRRVSIVEVKQDRSDAATLAAIAQLRDDIREQRAEIRALTSKRD